MCKIGAGFPSILGPSPEAGALISKVVELNRSRLARIRRIAMVDGTNPITWAISDQWNHIPNALGPIQCSGSERDRVRFSQPGSRVVRCEGSPMRYNAAKRTSKSSMLNEDGPENTHWSLFASCRLEGAYSRLNGNSPETLPRQEGRKRPSKSNNWLGTLAYLE